MKHCGLCSNQIPEGRVVARCDGCLALYYYGNALDQILDLLQESGRPKLGLMHKIAQKAVKTVPRTTDPAKRAPNPVPLDLREYAIERRIHLANARKDYAGKSTDLLLRSKFGDSDFGAVSAAKENFGTYRWIQGRLAEVDDLFRWIKQSERENEKLPIL